MFRSVRYLEGHICIRSSDATCYASMAVNTCFFSSGATTSKIWPPGAPKLGAELIFMSSLGCPPHWDSIVICTSPISSSKMSKTGNNLKKIRYISVITQKSVIFKKSKIDFKSTGSVPVSLQPLATITHAYFMSFCAYKVPMYRNPQPKSQFEST